MLLLALSSSLQARIVRQWVFNDGNWATTRTQTTGSANWTISQNENHEETDARNKWEIVPANNGIDKIEGLAFSGLVAGSLCLDWTYNCIWLYGSVTIPNLVKGEVITITAVNDATITIGGNTLSGSGTYTYNVTNDAPDGLTFSVNGKHIFSITVSNSEYDWEYTTVTTTLDVERNTAGTFTFTGTGNISGGTEIDEVPGIRMTVGAANDGYEWVMTTEGATAPKGNQEKVVNRDGTKWCPYSGCYIKFEPNVNGFLTLNGQFYATGSTGSVRGALCSDDEAGEHIIQEITSNVTEIAISEPLHAGKTYYLYCQTQPLVLHSFTFRPAFLNPTSGDDQTLTAFTAGIGTPAKDGFPKLIDPNVTTQQDGVKFAGDKTKVHLYKNNDVELLDAGTGILIRGTVLDKYGNDGLTAYYYLNSNVLKMNPEDEDQAYITGFKDPKGYAFSNSKQNDEYGPMSVVDNHPSSITVQKDGGTPYTVTPVFSEFRWVMYIPISPLEEGSTYRITIPEGYVKDNKGALNPEIVHTFSVKNASELDELEVKMIYPSGLATVGTTIILDTYVNGSTSGLSLNDNKKVTGILSTDGEEDMVIHAGFSTNQLVFKPESTLKPNKTYTLTIYYNADNNVITSKELNSTIYQVTHTKVFTFKTGSASGTAPRLISTIPLSNDEVNASTRYANGTISFTFDQNVELEPYSTVTATPINGSESTASGKTGAPGTTPSLTIGEDKKTISFNYSADELKYDLYYEVVIPANTVIGAGGTPNDAPITLKFKMERNPNSTEVTSSMFYPHTWDFSKFGSSTTAGTTAYNIINYCGDPGNGRRVNSLYKSGNSYKTKPQDGYGFDQGNNIYFHGTSNVDDSMDEFEGIRISLVHDRSDRFEIRKESSTNADGTDEWSFRMIGNTHYMTISKVPAGKLYMVISAKRIGINSPNATFESVDGVAQPDNTTVLNTNDNTKKVVVNVATAGDVSFCVYDFTCHKIGVAVDEKTFKADFAENGKTYATDRITYDVRYDLLNAFTNHDVKAYYVSNIANNPSDNTGTIVATEVPLTVAESNQGVMVLYQSALGSNTMVPIFKTDVNSPASNVQQNHLKVIAKGSTTLPSISDDKYMYVLSNGGTKTSGISFYRYTGSIFSDRAAYLEVPKTWVEPASGGASRIIRLVFEDEDGNETTMIRTVEANGISENIEQNGGYHDLRGQRIVKPTKPGLYIKDGKKMYVK